MGHPEMRKIYPIEEYPIEVGSFKNLQGRVRRGITTTSWPRSAVGFYAFLASVGTAPKDMTQPTIGRKDHAKGYTPVNCGWQEKADNSSENASRINAARRANPEYDEDWRSRLSRSHMGITHSKETKKLLSKLASGRKISDETRRKLSLAGHRRKQSTETRRKISIALKNFRGKRK